MRIISGKYKGRKILVPKTKLRPTKDFTRVALFNIIHVKSKTVLDLYSGSGSFGIECLSRDCKEVIFIELNKIACETIKKNLTLINENSKVIRIDVTNFLKKHPDLSNYDIIFLDPPYNSDLGIDTIQFIDKTILNENVIIIYEHSTYLTNKIHTINLNNLKIYKTKKYGVSSLTFYNANPHP